MNKVLGNKKAISLFVVPALIIYTIIVMVPVIWSLYYSFFSGSPGLQWEFAGFDNYARLFRDKNFLNALTVNCKYVLVVTVGQVGMGLLLSLMFKFWLRRCKTIVRTLVFFPVVLPTVAVGQLFAKIYEIQPNYGLLNSLLDSLGFTNLVQPWIGQSSTALWALCVMDIWVAMGFYSVIFYGALLDISDDILEAARIDGCGGWQLFKNILLPLLRPILIYVMITSLIGGLQLFDVPQILTNGTGDPMRSTMTLIMFLNKHLYSKNYGMAGALSVVLFIITGILSLVVFKITGNDKRKG